MPRYAAKLLFGFEVYGEPPPEITVYEERIVSCSAETSFVAYHLAMGKGKEKQYEYENDAHAVVQFVFLGVVALLRLDLLLEDDEWWYEICELPKVLHEMKGELPSIDEVLRSAE